jgi:hypothetical protein
MPFQFTHSAKGHDEKKYSTVPVTEDDANGNIGDLERIRKQRDILEAPEKVSWW